MRKGASSQESGGDQSAMKTTLTDTFRDQKFTATVHKEGENIWRYKVSGSLPNPCWNYTVEAGPISPVAGNPHRPTVSTLPPHHGKAEGGVVRLCRV